MRDDMLSEIEIVRRLAAVVGRDAPRTADAENDTAAQPDRFRETPQSLRPFQAYIIHLREPVHAWIVEGNATRSGIEYLNSSWITDVEAVTGRTRGWCSFEGCGNMADVGGRVRLANSERVVLAPICRACNNPENEERRQGGNSRLLARSEVFQIERGVYEYAMRDMRDMRPVIGDTLRLSEPVEAWNVDGAADAVPDLTGSWIAEAEAVTGRRRGRCSFEGCPNMAEVGGHVWLVRIGCVLAPICRPCNNPRNMARRQGGGSYLRANIEVFRTHMTEGMFNAPQLFAEEPVTHARRCERCGVDISDRPPNHAVCLNCYSGDRGRARLDHDNIYARGMHNAERRYAEGSERPERPGRWCRVCEIDISDMPANYLVCSACYLL